MGKPEGHGILVLADGAQLSSGSHDLPGGEYWRIWPGLFPFSLRVLSADAFSVTSFASLPVLFE